MKSITFECEIITPMFLAGTDGKTPELRPPSIKGAMRFWWRAMNGSLSLEDLKEKEAAIFGGSGKNEGRSKIIIKIENNNSLNKGNNIKKDYNLSCNFDKKNHQLTGKNLGICYLLYSTYLSNGRSYYKDKQNFKLKLISKDLNALKHAVASFWSLVYFGGIGTRARRGGGNITITNVIDKDNVLIDIGLDFSIKGKESNEIAKWLKENYDIAKRVVNEKKKTRFISEYSNLSISRFIISNQSFDNWKEALNDIGKQFANFRHKNKDHIFEMAIFGLPVLHRQITIIGGKIQNNKIDNKISRRGSPLIFKILKSNGKYYWMVLRLAGEFLPEGKVLISKQNRNQKTNHKTQAPSFDKFDEFWNSLKSKRGGKEYILSKPDKLKELKKKLKKELSPKKIILFGSKARGDFHKDSDIDIAVDTNKSIGLTNINGAVDIVNLNRIDKTFKEKIEKEGIEI